MCVHVYPCKMLQSLDTLRKEEDEEGIKKGCLKKKRKEEEEEMKEGKKEKKEKGLFTRHSLEPGKQQSWRPSWRGRRGGRR